MRLWQAFSSDDRRWLREVLSRCDGTSVKDFIKSHLNASRDSRLTGAINRAVDVLEDDEIMWLGGEFERERRRERRQALRKIGRKSN